MLTIISLLTSSSFFGLSRHVRLQYCYHSKSPTMAPSAVRKPTAKPSFSAAANSSNSSPPNSYSTSSTRKSGTIGGGAVAGIIISLLIILLGCTLVRLYCRNCNKFLSQSTLIIRKTNVHPPRRFIVTHDLEQRWLIH